MKNRNLVIIIAALCIVSMGACFSPWDGSDLGRIVINFGDGGARMADGAGYTVILTGPDGTSIKRDITGGSTSFSVQPGPWNILVRAKSDSGEEQFGGANVEVIAGTAVPAYITMKQPAKIEEGTGWGGLRYLIEDRKQEFIMLSSSDVLSVENIYIEIPKGQNVTILANGTVEIIKGSIPDHSLFRIPSGSSLTLGVAGGGMDGTITIRGNNNDKNSSLIYVGKSRIKTTSSPGPSGGILTMYEGVVLTGNTATVTVADRGGAIVVEGGTFNMYGGTISKNSAPYGGGVRVVSGTFTKTGGTIYGSNGGENSNTARGDKNGHAVYYDASKKYIDTTLGPKDNL